LHLILFLCKQVADLGIDSLAYQLETGLVIALDIRGFFKLRKNPKVWFVVPYASSGSLTILQQKQVSKPG
jgi:hypothetical protein